MKQIVKSRNLIAFRIWFEKLGYDVEIKTQGFVAKTNDRQIKKRLQHVLVVDHKNGNPAAFELGQEFEAHLVSPNLSDKQNNDFTQAMANQIGMVA